MNEVIKLIVRNVIYFMLSPLEKILLRYQRHVSVSPPVFILGAPRSGTTLLYELLVSCYEFSYFTNLANSFPFVPLSISKLTLIFKRGWSGTQESNFGVVGGIAAPSEAGNIWARWISEFDYLDERDAKERKKKMDEATKVIQALQELQGAPFLNKNVMHSVHVRFLNIIFPGCLFIEIRRDIKANVRSIIRAREQGGGPLLDPDGWWSVRPRGVDLWCGLSMEEQACAQVVLLRKDIDEDFKSIGENRRFIVNYEEICQNPTVTLEAITEFIKPICKQMKILGSFPAPIEQSSSLRFSSERESVINNTLKVLGES